MLQIPAKLTNQFTAYIGQQDIPAGQHRYYLKWMRYYLDFCHKYHFKQGTDASLSAFLKKLNEKKQSEQLQKQAKQAVQLYFAYAQSSKRKQNFKNKDNTPHTTNSSPNTYSDNRQEYKLLQGFSRAGLIQQLSSDAGDGYNVANATVAVDSLNIDWNKQAVRSAKQYSSIMGFSCKRLIEQLSSSAGDMYTVSQATQGARRTSACQ